MPRIPPQARGERASPSPGLTHCSFHRHPRNAWGPRGVWNPWATWKAWLHQRSQGRHRSPWHTRLARISWGVWPSWNYGVPRIHRKPGEWVPLLSSSREIHSPTLIWDQPADLEAAAKTVPKAISQHKDKVPFHCPCPGFSGHGASMSLLLHFVLGREGYSRSSRGLWRDWPYWGLR